MMNIFRAEHSPEFPYVRVAKPTANDKKLSFAARGLLTWLLDKPDNWNIEPDAIARLNETDASKVKKLLKELADKDYLIPPQRQHIKGRFKYTRYILRERPDIPLTDDEKQSSENSEAVTVKLLQDDCYSETVSDSPIRTGTQHENATVPITKINNNSNQEHEILTQDTATALPAVNPGAIAPESFSSSDVIIPVFRVKVYFPNVPLLPANVPEHPDFKAKAQSTPPPISAPPPPRIDPPDEAELKFRDIVQSWDEKTGNFTSPRVLLLIQKSVDAYPKDWIVDAIKIAETKGKLFWEFVEGILLRWKLQGGKDTDRGRTQPVIPANQTSAYDDIFNREPAPEAEQSPPEPVDPLWQRLCDTVKTQSRTRFVDWMQKCSFGGFVDGILTIHAPDEKCTALNHRKWLDNFCEVIWTDFKSVNFIVKGVT